MRGCRSRSWGASGSRWRSTGESNEGLDYHIDHLDIAGLSWVAPWVLLSSIVIPVKPRKALIASVASVSAVPITMALTMKFGGTSFVLTPEQFFGGLVLPYLLVVIMAQVGARAIYGLGTDVAKARELGSFDSSSG